MQHEHLHEHCVHCDVVINVAGRRMLAHSAVLAASSTVLHRRFIRHRRRGRDNGDSVEHEITLDGDWDIWHALLEFVYTGVLRVCCWRMALALLEPARRFLIESLTDEIERFLWRSVRTERCIDMYRLADSHGLIMLKDAFKNRISNSLGYYSRDPRFTILEIRLVEELLYAAAVRRAYDPKQEYELFVAIARWLRPHQVRNIRNRGRSKCRHCHRESRHALGELYLDSEDRMQYESRLFRLIEFKYIGNDLLNSIERFARDNNLRYLYRNTTAEKRRRRRRG